jgi:cell wall-associated NlpC family hydrolase
VVPAAIKELAGGSGFIWGGARDGSGRGSPDLPLDGSDCSSFLANLLARLSKGKTRLPAHTDGIALESVRVRPGDEKPGDIVMLRYPGQGPVGYGHAGLFLGEGMMLDQSESPDGLPGRPGIGVRPVDHPLGNGGELHFRRPIERVVE